MRKQRNIGEIPEVIIYSHYCHMQLAFWLSQMARLEVVSRHADFSSFLCCGVVFQGNGGASVGEDFTQANCCGDNTEIGIKCNAQNVSFVLTNRFHFLLSLLTSTCLALLVLPLEPFFSRCFFFHRLPASKKTSVSCKREKKRRTVLIEELN